MTFYRWDRIYLFVKGVSILIIQFLIMRSQNTSLQSEDVVQPNNNRRQPQQFKALFFKNIKLQSKQMGTNLCQILTPILCIFFTYLMKTLAEENMPVGAIFQPLNYPFKFNDYQYFDRINTGFEKLQDERNHLKWVAYTCRQQCNASILGLNNGQDKQGLLGQIDSENKIVSFHPNAMKDENDTVDLFPPFFLPVNDSSVNQMLYNRLDVISHTDIDLVKERGGLDYLPDGTYDITLLTEDELKFDIKVNDARDLQSHRNNGVSRIVYWQKLAKKGNLFATVKDFNSYSGILELSHMLTNAFMNNTVESGYLNMLAAEGGVTFVDTIISFVAVLIFPISLSLLFPVFLYTVVLEKEQKLIQMMKMNGMKISSYWFVYFIFNLMLSFLTNLIFYLLGYFLTGMRFFQETDGFLMFIVLFGWSLAQIGMAVFFQTFLNKSRSANIIGYLISIWTSMIGSTLSIGVYQYPTEFPYGLRMFSPFGFVRILYNMLTACSEARCYSSISDIPSEMKDCIVFLYLNFLFFFILGTYLFEIVPQQFGVTRSVFFPFKIVKEWFNKCSSNNQQNRLNNDQLEEDDQLRQYINKNEEDPMSKRQRSNILSMNNVINENPLVINNLRKLYRKPGRQKLYAAVRSFNLKVGAKETFGLLGPNGAGKTTLISMITGMFEPNYGNAWIGGYDIRKNVEKAQLQMGVCPQFDLLWPQLTISEHLYFYARLKGIPTDVVDQKVQNALKDVNLTKFKNFPSSSLSGGMKRRLSVAISLVGDPKIVFLDQPSTGLDPENRRQLWQVLAKCQKDRAIFITTHMMEEADALCNRVGIITSGVLRTVGPQPTLKKIYGQGYRITISTLREQRKLVDRNSIHMLQGDGNIEDYQAQGNQQTRKSIDSFVLAQQRQKAKKTHQRVQQVAKFMSSNFEGCSLQKQFNGYLIFKVPLTYKVSQIFQLMEKMEKELDIVDVGITTSSLEDVFMNVVKEYDQEARREERGEGNEEDEQFRSFPNAEPIVDGEPVLGGQSRQMATNEKAPAEQEQFESILEKKRESVMSAQENIPKDQHRGSGGQSDDYY